MSNVKCQISNGGIKYLIITLLGFWILGFGFNPAFAQSGGIISDPMAIGVGARALGMGKAYVGMAEDGDAIFVNPAGIARITNTKFSSMYASLMSDVDYMVVGGAYPYGKKSAIGAGIINSSMGNILLTNSSGEAEGAGNWNNSVVFLSYGTYLSELHPAFYNLDRDVLVGGSLKYFSVGGIGSSSIQQAAGNGYSLDLGLLYPATDYLMLGANYQNAIAGKIKKSSGISEDIPQTMKLGVKMNLIGREGQSYNPHSTRKLFANVDYDLGTYGRPNVSHYGLEFWPNTNLALRLGADDSEVTAGMGIRFSGVEFNYAYHPYAGVNENTTHFFSIGYLGEAAKRMLRVHIDNPKDKMVIHEDFVKVSGRVEVIEGDEDEEPVGTLVVKVNGINIPVSADDHTFSAEIPVDSIGKKMFRVEARNTAGDYDIAEVRLVRLINFADVPDGYWAQQPIENTGTVGLIEGYPDGTFQPNRALTRAELATLLVRAKGLKLPDRTARKIFKDVPTDFWGAKFIETAEMAGLIKGYPDKTFRPNNKITKAEGIAVMARFDNLRTVAEVYEKPFWDVSTKSWSAKYIQAAKEAGLLKFVERNMLRPNETLARAEAVEMLSQTSLAGGEIKDLYSWEKGFHREFIPEKRPKTRAGLVIATAD